LRSITWINCRHNFAIVWLRLWSSWLNAYQIRAKGRAKAYYKLKYICLKILPCRYFLSILFYLFRMLHFRIVIPRAPFFFTFIYALLSQHRIQAHKRISQRQEEIITSVARSRNFAQQIKRYHCRCWQAYRRLTYVWVDLLALHSCGSLRLPLANQLNRPGLRSLPCRITCLIKKWKRNIDNFNITSFENYYSNASRN